MKTMFTRKVVVLLLLVASTFTMAERVETMNGRTNRLKRTATAGGLSFSPEQQQLIVDIHNNYRSNVDPPAEPGSMKTMVWDQEVEEYARDWAQCKSEQYFQHRSSRQKNYKNYGENMAYDSTPDDGINITAVTITHFKSWWNENKNFQFADGKCIEGRGGCGHYTQMAWANSSNIGCGYALNCPKSTYPSHLSDDNNFYIVCNYAPRGNIGDSTGILRPYSAA